MNIQQLFDPSSAQTPFESYAQYSSYLFACVDLLLRQYVNQLMNSFTSENGFASTALAADKQRQAVKNTAVRFFSFFLFITFSFIKSHMTTGNIVYFRRYPPLLLP